MANRTTNERFSRRAPKVQEEEDGDGSENTSSIMSMSDFDTTSLTESGLEKSKEALRKKKLQKKKKKGCCINCWKMCIHTQVVPQKKLYNYLAERSSILSNSDLMNSIKENDGKNALPSDNSHNHSGPT